MTKLQIIKKPLADTVLRIARKHLSIPTLEPRNSDELDIHSVSVWGVKEALNAAFQAGAKSAVTSDKESAIDIHQLLEQRRQVGVIWSIEDAQALRPDLDDDQSWQVLQQCSRSHDCNYGFTWDSIQCAADDMFPAPEDGDGQ